MKYLARLVIGLLLLAFGLAVLAGGVVAALLFIAYIAVRLLIPKKCNSHTSL